MKKKQNKTKQNKWLLNAFSEVAVYKKTENAFSELVGV